MYAIRPTHEPVTVILNKDRTVKTRIISVIIILLLHRYLLASFPLAIQIYTICPGCTCRFFGQTIPRDRAPRFLLRNRASGYVFTLLFAFLLFRLLNNKFVQVHVYLYLVLFEED